MNDPSGIVDQRLVGWGNYPQATEKAVYLAGPLQRLDAFNSYPSLTPRGLGRSYGDASLPAPCGLSLQTPPWNEILAFDAQSGRITAGAGVSLGTLLDRIVPAGWFLPVTPGTRFVTLGGALATNVHGKNHHRRGAISRFVRGFSLLTESGVVDCTPTGDPDLFAATVGGFGMTGLIQSITIDLLRIRTSTICVQRIKARDLDDLLAILEARDAGVEYSITWVDTSARGGKLGRGIVMLGDHAEIDDLPADRRSDPLAHVWKREKRVPRFLNGWVLSPWTERILNQLFYAKMRSREVVGLRSLEQWFYPLDSIRDWNQIYGRRGFLQYQLVVPGARGIQRVLEHLVKRRASSFVAGLKRMGKDEVMLPFAMKGFTFGIDFGFFHKDVLTLLDELDEIVLDQGGRVCLSKDARLSPAMFRAMFPEFERWREVVRRYAPTGRFSSRMAQRLQWQPPLTLPEESTAF